MSCPNCHSLREQLHSSERKYRRLETEYNSLKSISYKENIHQDETIIALKSENQKLKSLLGSLQGKNKALESIKEMEGNIQKGHSRIAEYKQREAKQQVEINKLLDRHEQQIHKLERAVESEEIRTENRRKRLNQSKIMHHERNGYLNSRDSQTYSIPLETHRIVSPTNPERTECVLQRMKALQAKNSQLQHLLKRSSAVSDREQIHRYSYPELPGATRNSAIIHTHLEDHSSVYSEVNSSKSHERAFLKSRIRALAHENESMKRSLLIDNSRQW